MKCPHCGAELPATEAQAAELSLGMRIVSVLGALALGVSAFYFFYRIWGLISFPSQVAILVGAPLAGLLLVSVVSRRDPSGHFAAIAITLALACFVAGVTVLSRIVNAPSSPYALLAWGSLAIVLAYGHRLRLPLAAGVLLLAGFLAAWIPHALGLNWEFFMERPEGLIPGGLLAFMAPRFSAARRYPPFAIVYRLLGALLVLWPTLVLSLETNASYLHLDPAAAGILYPIVGFLAAGAAIAIGVTRRYKETVYCGFVFFVAQMFARCFDWWWSWMPRYLFFLVLAVAAIAVLFALRRLRAFMSIRGDAVRP